MLRFLSDRLDARIRRIAREEAVVRIDARSLLVEGEFKRQIEAANAAAASAAANLT